MVNLNTLVADMEKMLPRLIGEDIQLRLILDPAHRASQSGCRTNRTGGDEPGGQRAGCHAGRRRIDHRDSGRGLRCGVAREHPRPAWPQARYVMLAVTDTGTGIDPENLAHIFEPFFTTKGGRQGNRTGARDRVWGGETKQWLHRR